MLGRTHKFAGFCAGAGVGLLFLNNVSSMDEVTKFLAITSSGVFGSILPDIDKKGSLVDKKMKLVGKAIRIGTKHRGITHYPIIMTGIFLLIYYYFMKYPFQELNNTKLNFMVFILFISSSSIFLFLRKKRGFSLTTLFFAFSSIYLLLSTTSIIEIKKLFELILFSVYVGYLSHMVLDSFTKAKIKWLYPLVDRGYGIFGVETGKKESIGYIAGILFFVSCVMYKLVSSGVLVINYHLAWDYLTQQLNKMLGGQHG